MMISERGTSLSQLNLNVHYMLMHDTFPRSMIIMQIMKYTTDVDITMAYSTDFVLGQAFIYSVHFFSLAPEMPC